MVRYLILNTPKLMETLGTYPRDTQEKLIEAVLAYGETNGEEPSEYGYRKEIFKEWQEVKPCLSWGDTIQEETTEDKQKTICNAFSAKVKSLEESGKETSKEYSKAVDAFKEQYARTRNAYQGKGSTEREKITLEGNSDLVKVFNSLDPERQKNFLDSLSIK